MKKYYILLWCAFLPHFISIAQEKEPQPLPTIALLGMFHFGETSDLGAIKMKDLHGEKRQAEIQELVASLKDYQPTKILVEYPFVKQETLQKRYEDYLAGNYTLGDSETYQVGFRLAKALGHEQVYAMDHKLNLPFDSLVGHLTANGQMVKMERMVAAVHKLMAQETALLEGITLSQYLQHLNSEKFDALANSLYLKEVLEMGSTENEVGAMVSSVWYQRNMVMLKHIAHYIESPQERILVIVGASHRAVIKDYIHDRIDLTYEEIADYLNTK